MYNFTVTKTPNEQCNPLPLSDALMQVSCIGHDWEDIPDFLGAKYGELARRLDLSFNQLR